MFHGVDFSLCKKKEKKWKNWNHTKNNIISYLMCSYLFGQDYSSAILDDKDVVLFGFCYPGLGFAFVILLTFLFV